MNSLKKIKIKKWSLLLLFAFIISNVNAQAVAQNAAVIVTPSIWDSPLFWVFAFAILGLLLVIIAIGGVLVGLVNNKISKQFQKTIPVIFFFFILGIGSSQAQTVSSTVAPNPITQIAGALDPTTIMILMLVVAIELFVILYLFAILQKMLIALGYKTKAESKWTYAAIMKRMTKAIPLDREAEVATDHNYDGIIELDNSLPPWWVYMFYGTIIFAFTYMIYFTYFDGPTQQMEYDTEVAQAIQKKNEFLKKTAALVDETSVLILTDATALAKGKSSYITKCAACHGMNGEGLVGPNLTDDYWIHGGSIKDIFKTIKYGWPEKGMISWENQITPMEMQQISSFIITIKGTNPANPKAPQGTIYVEPAAIDTTVKALASDTLKVL
jgi:cytochrome c oxidase cbb3-type subunit 3